MSEPTAWPPPPPESTPSPPTVSTFAPPEVNSPTIGAGPAVIGWFVVWIVSNVTSALAALAFVSATGGDITSMSAWGTVVALVGQWAVIVVGLVLISKMFGSGDLRNDYGIRFKPFQRRTPGFDVLRSGRPRFDFFGFFAGIATQLILLPLLYLPLRLLWPDTFSSEQLEERSRSLVEGSSGVGLIVLALCIAIGAPLIEETMYRGLLQRSLGRPLHRVGAWLLASTIFAGVHLAPIEFPGLLVAGLVFGLGVLLKDRIGFGLAAHFGFNATAVLILLATV